MKKLVVLFVFLGVFKTFAQQNEVKLDLFDILALRSLDVAYERQINDEASVGLSVFVNFEEKKNDFRYNEDFQIVPYFRQNFKQIGSFDLFGELFGSLNFAESEEDAMGETEKYTDFALGLGAGLKRVSNNGYIFEVHAGIGRNLFNTKKSEVIVPRFGLSVGKRF